MNAVIGHIFTGLCGGLLMLAFNQWMTLTGWLYWASIAGGFIVCFVVALIVERVNAKKAFTASSPDTGLGSHNKSGAGQEIEISTAAVGQGLGPIGSHNHSKGDQKIKVG